MITPERVCIILTSTICVNRGKIGLVQTDADERRKLYLARIKQWLNCTTFRVVLVENSGYMFPELREDLVTHCGRFEICTYDESVNEEATYLRNDQSKGCSELFAINYAYRNSLLAKNSEYIIKVTCRYFVAGLENFVRATNLEEYAALTQQNPDRCELVGCRLDTFGCVFFVKALDETGNRHGHVERVYKFRMDELRRQGSQVLVCPEFPIEPTPRGGVNSVFTFI